MVDDAGGRSYRSGLRQERARRTRGRILAAATSVFLARGYAGTTVRAVAQEAGVSVPTVELAFGTKARLLKAAIDVAIAGDDATESVLERPWTAAVLDATDAAGMLRVVAGVLGAAQARSAGLVLAVLEGAATDPDLAALAEQRVEQRRVTAAWIVDALAGRTALRAGCTRAGAVETVWLLMDPAIFDRGRRHLRWSQEQYELWFATAVRRLLLPDDGARPPPRSIDGSPRPEGDLP